MDPGRTGAATTAAFERAWCGCYEKRVFALAVRHVPPRRRAGGGGGAGGVSRGVAGPSVFPGRRRVFDVAVPADQQRLRGFAAKGAAASGPVPLTMRPSAAWRRRTPPLHPGARRQSTGSCGSRSSAGLKALSPEHRAVLVLRELHQLSYDGDRRDLASWTLGTVKSRISRGRRQLREFLTKTAGTFLIRAASKRNRKGGL